MRTLRLLALASVFSLALPALAQGSKGGPSAATKAEAKKHFDSAEIHFRLGEFADAVVEYKEAYRLLPDPAFLFDIAQCYRQLNNFDQSLLFFKNYIEVLPDAPNRQDVEKIMTELRSMVTQMGPTKPDPTKPDPTKPDPTKPDPTKPDPTKPDPTKPDPTKPGPVEPTSAALTPTGPNPATGPTEGPHKASPIKWWMFAIAGGVAAAAGVSIAVATSGTPIPSTGLGDQDFGF